MQRMLVIAAVIVLVVACLGMGTLAAHWPFWQRAWQWQVSDTGWPATIKGQVGLLRAADEAQPLDLHEDASLAASAATASTQALLRAHADGRVDAWFAPGTGLASMVDGRALTPLLLAPVYAQLLADEPRLLDTPVGAWLPEWRGDRRGPITPRQLFWQLSGFPAGDGSAMNPFSSRAQLRSGPDFSRAVLRWQPEWPPGSHFEESPANAQLLSLLASRIEHASFIEVLERRVWSRLAQFDAIAMLDHRRGDMAAHCCLRASIGDWMRVGLLLATDGSAGGARLWSGDFLAQVGTASPVHAGQGLGVRLLESGPGKLLLAAGGDGRELLVSPAASMALLWIGEGPPPPGLAQLLP